MKWDLTSVLKFTYGASVCTYGLAELHPDEEYGIDSLRLAKGAGAVTLVAGLAAREQERDDNLDSIQTTVNTIQRRVEYVTERARENDPAFDEDWDEDEFGSLGSIGE